MLSDEEREAIKNLRLNVTNVGFSVYDGTTSLFKMRDIQIVLNLIEKQSKEIEELKDFNTKLQATKDRLDSYDKENTLEIEKLKKEIEELKREKETNQQMIHLAETQILGYGQGYKDGLNKETTATAIVARERENQIIYEGIKHKINMEWVLKIKAKIEEYEKALNILLQKNEWIEPSDTIIRNKFMHYIEFGQSLLEKE